MGSLVHYVLFIDAADCKRAREEGGEVNSANVCIENSEKDTLHS
jgi:hypothetical protein